MEIPSDIAALKLERERLDQEQDDLLLQLESNPNDEEAKKQLIEVLGKIKSIDGKENKNINLILQNLNKKAGKDLLVNDLIVESKTEPEELDSEDRKKIEAFYGERSREELLQDLSDLKEEINRKLPLVPPSLREYHDKSISRLNDRLTRELKGMSNKELAGLIDDYEMSLSFIETDIKKS